MELFQSYFIFWKFLFETRVIELRVRVKQNTKIKVFWGYAQRYKYRVLQTIQMKLILLWVGQSRPVWAELKLL